MKNLLLILIVCCSLNGFGQGEGNVSFDSIEGLWCDTANKTYLEIKKDSFLLSNLYTSGNNPELHYETQSYNLILIKNQLKIESNWYLTTGIRFWRLRDRCVYDVTLPNDSNLLLNLSKLNHKKSNIISILMRGKNLSYQRVSKDQYLKILK